MVVIQLQFQRQHNRGGHRRGSLRNICLKEYDYQRWNQRLACANIQSFPITSGKSYKITFKAKADAAKTIKVVFQQNYSPYTHYYNQAVNVTTGAADYGTFTYNCTTTDSNVSLCSLPAVIIRRFILIR